ncbi:MAG: phosphate acyltransferase [Bacteroidaceae bacterium]|nr:phosphate acyltransferase [Bacteroidaceae bacterium]
MISIKNFSQLTNHLKSCPQRKRVAVVCPYDIHSEYAILRALEEELASFVLIGQAKILNHFSLLKKYPGLIKIIPVDNSDDAACEGVRLGREGKVDILMKGVINTDNLLHAVLDKERGLLPKGRLLTHLAVMQIPSYDKLLFFSDAAVIPSPTLKQRVEMIGYAIRACHKFGIEQPRISLIHCTEKVSAKFPHSLDYVNIVELAEAGEFGNVIIDGPLDVLSSCDKESAEIKGISSPINGQADVLIFPNLESGNTFYKAMTLFAGAEMGGLLQGPDIPVVVTSRSDSGLTKYYSLAMGCLISDKS